MSSQATSKETEAPFSMRSILGPLIAIVVGIFMVILDGTAVNVALPKLQEEFEFIELITCSMDGYRLCLGTSCGYSVGRLVIGSFRCQENFPDFRRSLHDWLRVLCFSELG